MSESIYFHIVDYILIVDFLRDGGTEWRILCEKRPLKGVDDGKANIFNVTSTKRTSSILISIAAHI